MERQAFQHKEVIFRENDYQKYMYSICEGSVDIYSGYGTPQEKKLITLTEGQFFGEIGMIAMMPRTASAVAAGDHVVLEQIGQEDFIGYLKAHPENLQHIMSSVSRRLRELTEDLAAVTQLTNEALRQRENTDFLKEWLAGSVSKLMGMLKAKRSAENEFASMRKRQLILAGAAIPVMQFHAGDVIFRAGDEADCMYDICNGCVGIYSAYRTENEKLLTRLYADHVFGEMGILDDMPRSATAVCLEDCSVRVVRPENFMKFFQDNPAKVMQILQQMCMQLRDLTKTYLQVCKTLEEMPALDEKDFQTEAMAKLEYIQVSQLCGSIYNIYGYEERLYEYL